MAAAFRALALLHLLPRLLLASAAPDAACDAGEAAEEAVVSGGCAAADEESDGVGLLQSAGQRARAVQQEALSMDQPASGGWVAKAALCGVAQKTCGSGCCKPQDKCNSDQMCEFRGATTDPTPGEVGCPRTFKDLGDDGCCPAGLLLGPPESCVQRTCENILQYNCSVASGGAPTCTEGGELPAGVTVGVTVNGAAVVPTAVSQTCTLDGKSCYTWSVDTNGQTIQSGTAAPDCEAVLLQSSSKKDAVATQHEQPNSIPVTPEDSLFGGPYPYPPGPSPNGARGPYPVSCYAGQSTQCPGSPPGHMCAGNQCCPGIPWSGYKTFVCPSATSIPASNCAFPAKAWYCV